MSDALGIDEIELIIGLDRTDYSEYELAVLRLCQELRETRKRIKELGYANCKVKLFEKLPEVDKDWWKEGGE